MNRLRILWTRLLPDTENVWARGRAGLVTATCIGLAGAMIALVLTWLISGDLQWETVVATTVFTAILAGIVALSRSGRTLLAVWLLVGLLTVLMTVDVIPYGLGSPSVAGYVIPIVLAACGIGLRAGLAVAGIGSATAWLVAWATTTSLYEPWEPVHISHLTFTAPAMTVIFFLTALVVGFWTYYLRQHVYEKPL